jgi:hypothetical protein
VRRRVAPVLRRLSLWMQCVIVAVALLVAVSVAASLLRSSSRQQPASRRATEPARTAPPAQVPSYIAAVAHADLARARRAAGRFLASYLRFAYGRASARSVAAVSRAVRDQLMRGAASATPAERRRHPRVVLVQVTAPQVGVARATGLVEDGGVTSYIVRVTLRRERSGWVVSAIGG